MFISIAVTAWARNGQIGASVGYGYDNSYGAYGVTGGLYFKPAYTGAYSTSKPVYVSTAKPVYNYKPSYGYAYRPYYKPYYAYRPYYVYNPYHAYGSENIYDYNPYYHGSYKHGIYGHDSDYNGWVPLQK